MMYELTVPQFSKMLKNLDGLLDKAAGYADQKKFESEVLLQSRLAPDQFNFIRQVQIACDTAKLCVARMSGKEAPKNEDNEKTLPELKARIKSTLQFLESVSAKDFTGSETKKITQPRWEGKHLLGEEYVLQHALPNLYFHIMTAYSILRHNGVDIGKKDYLGTMPYKQ